MSVNIDSNNEDRESAAHKEIQELTSLQGSPFCPLCLPDNLQLRTFHRKDNIENAKQAVNKITEIFSHTV